MNLFKDLAISLKPEKTSTQKHDFYIVPFYGVDFEVNFTYDGQNRFGEPLFFEPNGINVDQYEYDDFLNQLAQDIIYDKAYRMLKSELIENQR